MPRSSGRRSAPAPRAAARAAPRPAPPAPVRRAPPPAAASARVPPPPAPSPSPTAHQSQVPMQAAPQQSGGMMSGLMGTMANGMAFGAGSAVAHKAIGAASSTLFGGSSAQEAPTQEAPAMAAQAAQAPKACDVDKQAFFTCLKRNDNEADKCTDLFQSLQMCQDNAKWQTA